MSEIRNRTDVLSYSVLAEIGTFHDTRANDIKNISRASVRRSSESEVGSFVQVDQTEVVAAFWAENKREFLSVSVQTNHGGSSLKLSVAGISDSLMHMRKMSL